MYMYTHIYVYKIQTDIHTFVHTYRQTDRHPKQFVTLLLQADKFDSCGAETYISEVSIHAEGTK